MHGELKINKQLKCISVVSKTDIGTKVSMPFNISKVKSPFINGEYIKKIILDVASSLKSKKKCLDIFLFLYFEL